MAACRLHSPGHACFVVVLLIKVASEYCSLNESLKYFPPLPPLRVFFFLTGCFLSSDIHNSEDKGKGVVSSGKGKETAIRWKTSFYEMGICEWFCFLALQFMLGVYQVDC